MARLGCRSWRRRKSVFNLSILYAPNRSLPNSQPTTNPDSVPIAVNAAYETVSAGFVLDCLHTNFITATRSDPVLSLHVQSISDGGRFAVRLVQASQEANIVLIATCTFVRLSAMQKGPSMEHCVKRFTSQTIDAITLDDLAPSKTHLGPWMKYQRLPLQYLGQGGNEPSTPPSSAPSPDSWTYTSVAQLSTPMSCDERRLHTLGIIALSDYHVLDCPPTVHGFSFALPNINDTAQIRKPHDFDMLTSLNHSVHFHVWEGFQADQLCYIEANSPWTRDRRGEINTRIFGKDGNLIATCKQQGYYVLKQHRDGVKL